MSEQLIQLGNVDETDTLGSSLHYAAEHGNKKALKKVLDKGIHVDYPNDEGQSPLFCASLCGNQSVVEYLLSAGADPNEKSNSGLTPVHAASYSGHVRILMKLLSEGGDLRLHDNQGRGVKDWAMLQPIPKSRMKMLEFLDKTRLFAMSSSGQDLLTRKASSKTIHRAHHRRNTVTKIIRDRIGRHSIHNKLEKMATDHHSVGFGQVYSNGAEKAGFISAIPLVCENNLKHDPNGETYNNGAFCVMESMWWDYTEVTIKRLHREIDPYQGGVVDILINDIQQIGKLRHPHILTLMGVCQTSNLDGLVVIYERIGQGSLYNWLHQKMERLPSQTIKDIALQMCNALIFIHVQGLVHCAFTSHAVSVVAPNMFKLGNFEYMLEISKCELGKKNAVATNTSENAVYNWMGPEIMINMPPSCYCDMYGYCAVIWEMFNGEVPWNGYCAEAIKAEYFKGNRLLLGHGQMPDYYKVFLKYGLELDPNDRKLSFLHMRDLLLTEPKDTEQYMRTHFQHLQQKTPTNFKTPPGSSATAPREEMRLNHDGNHAKKGRRNNLNPRAESGGENSRSKREEKKKKKQRSYNDDDYVNSRKGYNENCQLSWKMEDPLMKTPERGVDKQQRATMQDDTGLGETFPQTSRDHQFEANRFTINSGIVDDEAYHYTVEMQKKLCPGQESEKQVEFSNRNELYETSPKHTHEWTSSTSEDHGSTETTWSESQEYARGRTLERKISSMGNFSYLNLGTHTRTRSAGAKPACHGQSDMIIEEYSTAGKLTSAGSLYALYNEHSPDLPLGQRECREYQKFATLPNQHETKPEKVEADPRWFGGRGSVRDLAKTFQQQIQQHHLYQSVLDGSFKNNSNECQTNDAPQSDLYHTPEKIHHLAYDVDDDTSSEVTASSLNDQLDLNQAGESSTESDQISHWVDHELNKIKRNLSKEVAVKESLKNIAMSPDLFDKFDKQSEQPWKAYSLASSASYGTDTSSEDRHGTGDKERFANSDPCYYDDEIYMDKARVKIDSFEDDTDDPSLPMQTVLKETPTKEPKTRKAATRDTSGNRRLSRIPTSKSCLSSKQKYSDAAYANIVTIKSSLDDGGVHQVTHEMKNLKTGGSKTVFNDKVNAKKVVTTFRAAQ